MRKRAPVDSERAIVSHYSSGGSLHYLEHLAAEFEKMGYPIAYILPKSGAIGIKDRSACRSILKDPSTHPPFLRMKLLKYPYHVIKYLYNAFIIRPDHRTKVVHILFPFYLTDWITITRLKRRGIKVLLTVHEVFPHRPFLGGWIDKRLMRKMYENADLLIVHTESLRSRLIHLYPVSPQRIRVIRHGYFTGARASAGAGSLKQRYHVPPVKRVLLFFGTIRENKGLEILLRAMQELKSAYFLLIAGDTAGSSEMPAEHYKKMIEMTGLRDAVHWVRKYVSSEEAAGIFKIADAVILPYRKSFHAQSGVLNLAVGYEKPCVVSDVGGIGETVSEYNLGVVVRAEDPSALISGITRLFRDGTVSWGFKRYKRENSWQEVARRLISEYEAATASMP